MIIIEQMLYANISKWYIQKAKTRLFNLQCLSFYGFELWNIDSSELAQQELPFRIILNLHSWVHNIMVPQLMDTNYLKGFTEKIR